MAEPEVVAPPPTAAGPTPPLLADATLTGDAWRDLRRNPLFVVASAVIALMVALAVAPSVFAGLFGHGDPRACDLAQSNLGSSSGHPFGFDQQGCDLYANVIYGARPSIVIGIATTLGAALIALVLGTLAGYYQGWVDAVISRATDIFFGLPFLVGAIVILNTFTERTLWTVTLALVALGWMTMTRVVRSSTMTVRHQDYVTAARALGAGDLRIMRRHVIPNAIAPLIVLATLTVGYVIAAEATLTFLGVGLQLPSISWGLLLSEAQTSFEDHPHLLIFPGLFLSATVLSFILLGDAVRDALDPKLR
jgi:oligopeptide transport system permease protein